MLAQLRQTHTSCCRVASSWAIRARLNLPCPSGSSSIRISFLASFGASALVLAKLDETTEPACDMGGGLLLLSPPVKPNRCC